MPDTNSKAGGMPPMIVWFRDDLRLADNPALAEAAGSGRPVICLFVFDEHGLGVRPLGGATRWWLANSLRALDRAIAERGGRLVLRRGKSTDIVPEIAREIGATAVLWNRRYDAASLIVDRAVEDHLTARGIAVNTFQAALLFEPQLAKTQAGNSFSIFTPFWRHVRLLAAPRAPLPAPARLHAPLAPADIASDRIEDWTLEPDSPDWAAGIRAAWTPGEAGARNRAEDFFDTEISGYATLRDRPDLPNTSRLSPHLRFGEISPFQLWAAVQFATDSPGRKRPDWDDTEKFRTELGWREFSYHLLHHHPELVTRNFQPRFDAFPWAGNPDELKAWQKGRTGYPIVDAGMRELWTTGWMHNRVRMIAASFLVKHLLFDWRAGEAWFWDTLVDADPANNPASWQWVAGCGADAAPYFRILNPVLQAETFDPDGNYVRRWVPELAKLPKEFIHEPWRAPPMTLVEAGVRLGETYPLPIVDHKAARNRALTAFEAVKSRSA